MRSLSFKLVLMKYQIHKVFLQTNGGLNSSRSDESWAEKYEASAVQGIESGYLKFSKHLKRSPQQCIRFRYIPLALRPVSSLNHNMFHMSWAQTHQGIKSELYGFQSTCSCKTNGRYNRIHQNLGRCRPCLLVCTTVGETELCCSTCH